MLPFQPRKHRGAMSIILPHRTTRQGTFTQVTPSVYVFLIVCWCDSSYNYSAGGSNSAETFFWGARNEQTKVIFVVVVVNGQTLNSKIRIGLLAHTRTVDSQQDWLRDKSYGSSVLAGFHHSLYIQCLSSMAGRS